MQRADYPTVVVLWVTPFIKHKVQQYYTKTFNTKKNRRKPIIMGANEISTPPQDLSTPPQISDALKKRKLETFNTKEK